MQHGTCKCRQPIWLVTHTSQQQQQQQRAIAWLDAQVYSLLGKSTTHGKSPHQAWLLSLGFRYCLRTERFFSDRYKRAVLWCLREDEGENIIHFCIFLVLLCNVCLGYVWDIVRFVRQQQKGRSCRHVLSFCWFSRFHLPFGGVQCCSKFSQSVREGMTRLVFHSFLVDFPFSSFTNHTNTKTIS